MEKDEILAVLRTKIGSEIASSYCKKTKTVKLRVNPAVFNQLCSLISAA